MFLYLYLRASVSLKLDIVVLSVHLCVASACAQLRGREGGREEGREREREPRMHLDLCDGSCKFACIDVDLRGPLVACISIRISKYTCESRRLESLCNCKYSGHINTHEETYKHACALVEGIEMNFVGLGIAPIRAGKTRYTTTSTCTASGGRVNPCICIGITTSICVCMCLCINTYL